LGTGKHLHLSLPSYRSDIDGLRAVAVISVILFHAFPENVKGGFTGVDVFFVISGYLISLIILKSLIKGTFSFADFYTRRVRRIFPALAVVLISSLVAGWFLLFPMEYSLLGKHIAASAAFCQNLILWRESGYFDVNSSVKPLLHLWSLGVEEQFYFIWPVSLWAIWKRKRGVLSFIIPVAIASFAFNLWLTWHDQVAAFYFPFTRFWEFMAGGLLAWLTAKKVNESNNECSAADEPKTRWLINVLSLSGLALVLLSVVVIDQDAGFPGAWAAMPVLGAAFVIYSGPKAWVNRYILGNPLAVWIGIISYPLYLWHWPLLSFARVFVGRTPSIPVRLILVATAVLLAWLTYEVIEKPIRFNRREIHFVPALASFIAVVGLGGFAVFHWNGMAIRPLVQNGNQMLAYEWPQSKKWDSQCGRLVHIKPEGYCEISKNYPPSVALIGDSHANSVFDYFNAYFANQQRGVINLGKAGCPPFLGVERNGESCPAIENTAIDYVIAHPEINYVYIVARFAAIQSGADFESEPTRSFYPLTLLSDPSLQDRNAIFKIGLASTLDRLTKAKKNVTVLLDWPELDFDPESCSPRLGVVEQPCLIQEKLVTARQAAYREIIFELQRTYHFKVIDMSTAFCHSGFCSAKIDGNVLYRDRQHLGVLGNQYLLTSGFRVN